MNLKNIWEYIKDHKLKSFFIGLGVVIFGIIVVTGYVIWVNMGGGNVYSEYNLSVDGRNSYQVDSVKSFSRSYKSKTESVSFDKGVPRVQEYDVEAERKIIKNGNLSLIVKNINESQVQIKDIIRKYNGFIQNSNFSENSSYRYTNGRKQKTKTTKSGYFSLKVPVKNFEVAFNDLKNVALKVNSEAVTGEDVTEKYLDLATQIKNKKAEVEQYRKILTKAEEIKDVLEVTKYLNQAQSEYERLQGRMNRLDNQVKMSSIRVEIVAEKDIEVFGVTWAPWKEVKNGFSNFILDLKDFAEDTIHFIFKLPIYILYFGIFIGFLKVLIFIFKKLKKYFWR